MLALTAITMAMSIRPRPMAMAMSPLEVSSAMAVVMVRVIRLAQDPDDLMKHHAALAQALPAAKLFDAGRMVRQFEMIYAAVWERHAQGKPAQHIDVVL